MPIRSKITLWLESIQNGFVLILPIIIIGSLALTVIQIPILFPGYLASSFLLELASWVLAATLNNCHILPNSMFQPHSNLHQTLSLCRQKLMALIPYWVSLVTL